MRRRVDPKVARQEIGALKRAFRQEALALGFKLRSGKIEWAWRDFPEVQQRLLFGKSRGALEVHFDIQLYFRRGKEQFQEADWEPRADFEVSAAGLAMDELGSELGRLTNLELDYPPEQRIETLLRWFRDIVMPWLDERTTVESLVLRIDPETGHVRPPGLAFRSFYELIGKPPKVWPRPV